jgi:hypothetical protein
MVDQVVHKSSPHYSPSPVNLDLNTTLAMPLLLSWTCSLWNLLHFLPTMIIPQLINKRGVVPHGAWAIVRPSQLCFE